MVCDFGKVGFLWAFEGLEARRFSQIILLSKRTNYSLMGRSVGMRFWESKYVKEFCETENQDHEMIQNELKNSDYTITDKEWEIPKNVRYYMNKDIDEMIGYLNHKIGFRKVSESLYPAKGRVKI